MCLTHVRELIEQDAKAFHKLCPTTDYGIYCAGLNKKQLHHAVTFASIQSIHKKHIESGFINLCIIDEAHLLNDSEIGCYRKYLRGLLSINPKMRIIGLTATPYRLKSGLLHFGDGRLFHDIAYELPLQQLVHEGWLCRMIGKQAKVHGSTDGLHTQAGEYIIKECESVFDEERLVRAAVKEMIEVGHDRKTWLIFCVSIKHAEHVASVLNENDIECKSVSEKTPKAEREQIIKDMKAGTLRAVTNVGVMTTGTDVPNIDMIVMLCPTRSPGRLLQMAGRGFRLSPETGKENCLFLDMGETLIEHGPLTHITPPPQGSRKEKEKKGKVCPKCESVCASHATECADCGHIFEGVPRKIKHAEKGNLADVMSDAPILKNDIYQWYNVLNVAYNKHEKIGSKPSLKVTYKCGKKNFSEWISFESEKDFAKNKAKQWWSDRGMGSDFPETTDIAISLIGFRHPKKVAKIKVKMDGDWPEIKGYKFDESAQQKQSTYSTGNLADLHQRTSER